jgi:hypothetical protein
MISTDNKQESENEYESKMNVFRIIADMFLSPVDAMERVVLKKRLFVSFLIIFAGTLLFVSLNFQAFSNLIKQNIEMGIAQNNAPVSQDQIDAMANIFSYVGVVLFPLIAVVSWLLISLIFFAIVRLFKGQASYSQVLSIAGMAYMVKLVFYLLSCISGLFTGELYVNFSLALLALDKKGQFIYGILRGIELFDIWYFSLIGTGIYVITKLDKKKIILVTSLIFIGYVFLGASNMKNF